MAEDPEEWHAETLRLLEPAYLQAADVWGGSGFRGDAERWQRARGVIAQAIHRHGTFLDVGCANGLLMETMVEWARDRGHQLEPYGLELSPAVADLARSRLPQWASRIYTGNGMTWEPPRRFDFVRAELVYVPPRQRSAFVERLLKRFTESDGRLIVCSYGSSTRSEPAEPVGQMLEGWGHRVVGEAEVADRNGVVITRVAWLDADPRRRARPGREVEAYTRVPPTEDELAFADVLLDWNDLADDTDWDAEWR